VNEHEKAKRWREKTGLTVEELADKTGYSKESIYLFEKGFTYNGRTARDKIKTKPLDERVWHRYRMACAGVRATLSGSTFNW
jgi:transcriptional regulator with XRE-family HTH domain